MAATILLAAAVWGGQAQAQPRQVVTSCGTQTLVVGDGNNGYIDSTGRECAAAGSSVTGTAVTQTVTNAAYASGNAVGGLISFAAGGASGYIQKLVFNLPDAQTPTLDVVFFNANPTGSTITDKSAIVIAAADQAKMIGVAHISDCTGYSTPTSCQAQNLAIPYALASGTTIWAAIVARSAFTPSNLPVGTPAWALLFTTVR